MRKILSLAIVSIVIAGVARLAGAVSLTMGNPGTAASGGDTIFLGGTIVDLNHPATATGALTSVKLAWAGSCPLGSTKVKILHRMGNTLKLSAERAIAIPAGSPRTVTLSPGLPVQEGDLLGIYGDGSCGGVLLDTSPFAGTYLGVTHDDLEGSFPFGSDADVHIGAVALAATGIVSEYRAGVIAGVGSGPGLNGANFKTSLQMIAPGPGGAVSGRLVFHPAGAGGSTGDPSIDISIPQNHAISFPDVVTAMGQTGFGSIDVIVSPNSAIPVTLARVFNDQGAAGTSGLGEEMISTGDSFSSLIVPAGFTGYLSAPVDPTRTRFNIGVRTLDSGAFVSYTLKDESGNVKANASAQYPPNFFNQFHAEDLFGMALAANDIVEVSVSTGNAIVFGAATDQVTNDPSAQFVRPVFGVL